MKLLLDTHIWLWSVVRPEQLSGRVHRELADARNELWLSPVSTWETLLLHAKGRIRLASNLRDWMRAASAHFREAFGALSRGVHWATK